MTEELLFPWYFLVGIIIGIIVPIIGVAIAMGKLKQKVDNLSKSEEEGDETHESLFSKVNKIERNLNHLMDRLNIDPIK